MASLGGALGEELDTLVQSHAKAQGYSFAGPVSITVQRDDQLSTGTLRVDSSTAQGRVAWRGDRGRRGQAASARQITHRDRPWQRRRHHDLRRRHEPQARRDPVGRRARDGPRHELDQRDDAQRPQGRRSRAAAGLHGDDRPHRHRLPCRGAGRAPKAARCPPTTPRACTTSATAVRWHERTHPPPAAHRVPRPAVVLRLRRRLFAPRRSVRREGATDAGRPGRGDAAQPRPSLRRHPAPPAPPHPSPPRRRRAPHRRAARRRPRRSRASSSRAARRRASSCRWATSRSRSAARASRDSSSATTTPRATTPVSCCGASSG